MSVVSDHITEQKVIEDRDTIGKDGFFELSLYSEITQPVSLKIGNIVATLYVQPDFVYGITIPEADEKLIVNKDVELPINITIVGADSTELNNLIIDYQEQFNRLFIKLNNAYITRASIFKLADTLDRICAKRYGNIRNDYFKNFVRYSIASVNASVSRGESSLIKSYILNKPVQYYHNEYMSFFNITFTGYLSAMASRQSGQSLFSIINSSRSYDLLDNFAKRDENLSNDTLRELVIIKNLWDFYFNSDFSPSAVEEVINQVHLSTKIKQHKKITTEMIT